VKPKQTRFYLGDYYRTLSDNGRPEDFIRGPLPFRRDSAAQLGAGFTVRAPETTYRHGGRETRIALP
jgi:hypothetical protein